MPILGILALFLALGTGKLVGAGPPIPDPDNPSEGSPLWADLLSRDLFSVLGETSFAGLGQDLCTIPDLDGDGKLDLVTGSPNGGALPGSGIVLWFSSASGQEIGRSVGTEPLMALGTAVASPGDLDGDGVGDILAGAPGANDPGTGPSGAILALSGATGAVLWRTDGLASGEGLGHDLVVLEDMNGDGVGEVLASGPGSATVRGRLALLSGRTGQILRQGRFGLAGDDLGGCLALAGDLDGDGRQEIAVGSPGARQGTGFVTMYSRRRQPLMLLEGAVSGGRFGTSIAPTGDHDQDGITDFLVGAPGGSATPGHVHLLSGLDGAELGRLPGAAGELFGASLGKTADLDADGEADFLVGAPEGMNAAGVTSGVVHAISSMSLLELGVLDGRSPSSRFGETLVSLPRPGGAEVLVGSPGSSPRCQNAAGAVDSLYVARKTPVLLRLAADSFNPLGSAVASAGDVDGDGRPDIIVGVPLENENQLSDTGVVFIFSGRDGTELARIPGSAAMDRLGSAVCAVSDLDGDGRGEIAASAPSIASSSLPGRVEIHSPGLGTIPLVLSGSEAGGRFGACLASGADHDGDGFPDLLVGSPGADSGGTKDAGRIEAFSLDTGARLFVLEGTDAGASFGTSCDWIPSIDGDGIPDFIVGASTASPGGRLQAGLVYVISGADLSTIRLHAGEGFFDHLGTSVTATGDIDGDGVADYLLGAPDSNPRGLPDVGSAFLYSGATGALIRRIDGDLRDDRLGSAIDGIEDANGDGIPDLLIGAKGVDAPGILDAGKVMLISGADFSVLMELVGNQPGIALGHAVAAAGDVDADGFPELVAGGSGLGMSGSGGLLVVLDPEVSPTLLARVGAVNRGAGLPVDILHVNGETGMAGTRILELAPGQPIDVNLSALPGDAEEYRYAFFVWSGEPTDLSTTRLPHGAGSCVFPVPWTGGVPQAQTILNGLGGCRGDASLPVPDPLQTVYSLPLGLTLPGTLTFQAIVTDSSSTSKEGLAPTNAVIVIVR